MNTKKGPFDLGVSFNAYGENRKKKNKIEVGECLLLVGAEAFVFPFVIQKLKD